MRKDMRFAGVIEERQCELIAHDRLAASGCELNRNLRVYVFYQSWLDGARPALRPCRTWKQDPCSRHY